MGNHITEVPHYVRRTLMTPQVEPQPILLYRTVPYLLCETCQEVADPLSARVIGGSFSIYWVRFRLTQTRRRRQGAAAETPYMSTPGWAF